MHHSVTSQQCKHDYMFSKQSYDVLSTRYFKVNKTIELISKNFWWSQMSKFVKEFICICSTCAWAKARHHQPNGLLQPLTLLKVHGYPSLWTSSHLPPMIQVFWLNLGVVVNWLTKVTNFVLTIKDCCMWRYFEILHWWYTCMYHGLPYQMLSFIMDYNSSLRFERGGLIFGVLNQFFLSQSSTNKYTNFKWNLNMK